MKPNPRRLEKPSQKFRGDGPRPNRPAGAGGNKTYIGGRNAVRQLIKHAPERIVSLMVADSVDRMDRTGAELFEEIKEKRISFTLSNYDQLQKLFRHHQGFVAEVKPLQSFDLKALEDFAAGIDEGVILALDGVQDPQNLGSILRAADSFGVSCVVWSKNRSAPVTDSVSSASAGALQFVQTAVVSNLREALVRLKKLGFASVATIIGDEAMDLYSFTFPPRTILILGGESDGVQQLIAKESDHKVYVQQHGVVDSLNVGQATAVFLNEYRRQNHS